MESKGPVNSRLRRKVARTVSVALEQDSRKWKEGKKAVKARCGPVVLLGVRVVVFSVVRFGTTKIGETVHVMFLKRPVNCSPNSLVREGIEKVPMSSDLKEDNDSAVIWCVWQMVDWALGVHVEFKWRCSHSNRRKAGLCREIGLGLCAGG